MVYYPRSEKSTFARFRFGVDGGAILRGGAAFSNEWKSNPSKYVRGNDQINLVQRRMDGVILAAFVDSFLMYISDLLTLIFSKNPKMIPDGTVPQRLVWEHDDLDDLQWSIIERTVTNLSYKSFRDLDEYLRKSYGFTISSSKLNFLRLSYIFECRNSIVHNRGVISAASDMRLGAGGRLRDLEVPTFVGSNALAYLIDCADEIDARVAAKFGLSVGDHASHLKWLIDSRGQIERYRSKGKRGTRP